MAGPESRRGVGLLDLGGETVKASSSAGAKGEKLVFTIAEVILEPAPFGRATLGIGQIVG